MHRDFDAHSKGARVSQTAVSKLLVRLGPRAAAADATPAAATPAAGAAASSCPCVIRLTVLNTTESRGYKMKLVALFQGFRMYNPNFALCALDSQGRSQVR